MNAVFFNKPILSSFSLVHKKNYGIVADIVPLISNHINVVLCSFQPAVNWVVPVADRERYNDIFKQTDTDNDGLVTGTEVIEIFMQSSLSQTMLAQIW